MIGFGLGVAVGALTATGYAVYLVRGLRRQLRYAGEVTFKAQTRRAQQFGRFCEPCKKIINPSWIEPKFVHSFRGIDNSTLTITRDDPQWGSPADTIRCNGWGWSREMGIVPCLAVKGHTSDHRSPYSTPWVPYERGRQQA